MTVPAAFVSIKLKKLSGIGGIGLDKADRPYALAYLGKRTLGRSRQIPLAATELDFSAEPEPWAIEVPLAQGVGLPLAVEIWNDRGDDAPQRLLSLQGSVAWPWFPGKQTFNDGAATLEVEVATRYVPPDKVTALVPRSPEGLSAPAVVVVPNVILVEITEIKGLYQPGFTPSGVATPKRSEPNPGYRSEDHKGRVFLNRDLTGKYARDTQLVEAAVKVTVRRGALPGDAKVKWTVLDPHDPSVTPSDVHRQWAPYIDKGDYDGAGLSTGWKSNDNEGTLDKSPRWEQVGPFSLTVVSDTEAKTDIVSSESKVTVHCPNVAGDTIILQATVESATKVEAFGAETGVMTMWHRIDVEYVKMASALDIPVDDVPPYLEPACAELNVSERTSVADQPFMAPDHGDLTSESSKFVEANTKHIKDPGWFFVVAAMEPYPLPSTPGGQVYTGKVDIEKGGTGERQAEYVEIPGDHLDSDYVVLKWSGYTVGFSASSTQVFDKIEYDPVANTNVVKKYTRIWLEPHDVQPEFTAGDGSLSYAYTTRYYYFPRGRREGATWRAGGYGAPSSLDAEVMLAGAFYTSGISPSIEVGGKSYFAGRTLMFTHHGKYYDRATKTAKSTFPTNVVPTVAHELVHAFGMPHKCGHYDYLTPRDKTCPMNYSPNWMIDDNKDLIPGSSGKMGRLLCGRHLKEVRRVHLEDNGGLKSVGW